MVVEPVAVEQAGALVVKLEQQDAGVFTGDHRVQAPQPGGDGAHLAAEVAEAVDEVHRGFTHQQLRHLLKVGLAVEVGPGPLAVARPQAEAHAVHPAQGAGIDQPARLAKPGREAEVLMHHQWHA